MMSTRCALHLPGCGKEILEADSTLPHPHAGRGQTGEGSGVQARVRNPFLGTICHGMSAATVT